VAVGIDSGASRKPRTLHPIPYVRFSMVGLSRHEEEPRGLVVGGRC
jgi:hypothetical protein